VSSNTMLAYASVMVSRSLVSYNAYNYYNITSCVLRDRWQNRGALGDLPSQNELYLEI